ncbi:MAG: hypothetical protein Q4F06_03990 [Eubacteriales bacterium]|nr:hypothetical protein [Eubacteriales bacterium]
MLVNMNTNNDMNTLPFTNTNVEKAGKCNKSAISIDARNLNLGMSAIDEKRMSARKQAMKFITDAWGCDEKMEKGIQEMEDEKTSKAQEVAELKNKKGNIEKEKEMWRQEYGVSEDSQEYKDYKLLEKYQDNKTGASYDEFTEEEIERLKEFQNKPLTDFQKKALALNGAKDALDIEIEKGENKLIAMTASISMAKSEQIKSQDMQKAQDAADQILDAATKDIVGMLVDEAKEHLDEVSEEEKEKAEKLKEEQEKLSERTENNKERKEDGEKLIGAQMEVEQLKYDTTTKTSSVDHMAEAQKSIAKLMNDNHMINEDIKGIEIDLNF